MEWKKDGGDGAKCREGEVKRVKRKRKKKPFLFFPSRVTHGVRVDTFQRLVRLHNALAEPRLQPMLLRLPEVVLCLHHVALHLS